MERSEQIGELIAALAKAQAEFTAATKESENPYYNSKYADLAAVIGAVRPALSKNGIALLQFNESDLERQTASVTTALHCGEQFISITAEAPAISKTKALLKPNGEVLSEGQIKFDVQTLGAAWSYLRRYTLQAICGLASEDDDGNSLQNDNKPIAKRPLPPPPTTFKPKTQEPLPEAPPQNLGKEPPQLGKFLLVGDMLSCVVKGVTQKESKKHTQYLTVTFNGRVDGFNYAFCYDTKFFDLIKGAVEKEINIQIKPTKTTDGRGIQYFTIEDVAWIDGVEYAGGVAVPMEDTSNAK